MATGDQQDFLVRLKRVLPPWFGDLSNIPFLNSVLNGIAWLHANLQMWIIFARQQIRISTTSNEFLDDLAQDFLGDSLIRRNGETDTSFRRRISREILRPKVTRQAMSDDLEYLTGYTPVIIEPFNATDTKGWNTTQQGWNLAGCWGSLQTPNQAFIIAYRPSGQGVVGAAGWNTSQAAWGHAPLVSRDDVNGVTDDDIRQAVIRTKAAGKLIWLRIESFQESGQPARLDIDFQLDVSHLD